MKQKRYSKSKWKVDDMIEAWKVFFESDNPFYFYKSDFRLREGDTYFEFMPLKKDKKE